MDNKKSWFIMLLGWGLAGERYIHQAKVEDDPGRKLE
jgi:hypothetical protein